MDDPSLSESWHSLDEYVASCEECDHELTHEIRLTDDPFFYAGLEREDDVTSGGEVRVHDREISLRVKSKKRI